MKRALGLLLLCAVAGLATFALLLDEPSAPAAGAVRVRGPAVEAGAATPVASLEPSPRRDDEAAAEGDAEQGAASTPDAPPRARGGGDERGPGPRDLRGWLDRARQRLGRGDATGALADLDEALARDPRSGEAYHLRAAARAALGDLEGAEADRQRGTELGMFLAQDVVVRGLVVDAAGAPVGGAAVEARVREGPPIPATTTGPIGAYRLTLPAGTAPVELVVSAPRHAPGRFELALPLDPPAEVDLGTLRLTAGAGLRATLRSRDGTPLRGAVVVGERYVEVEQGGVVTVDDLPAGQARVTARAAGHAELRIDVVLVAGETLEQVLVLDRGARLRCRVTNGDGEPLAEARVWIVQGRTHETDDRGEAWLNLLAAGDVQVHAEHGDGVAVAAVRLVAGDEAVAHLVVGPPARLRGRVTRGGAPALAVVSLVREGDARLPVRQVFASSDGTYEVGGLFPGTWRVSVGSPTVAEHQETVTLAAGQEVVRDVDLPDHRGTIAGVLLDADGEPVSGEYVVAARPGEQLSHATTGADGEFELRRLPPAPLTLLVRRRSGQVAWARVDLSAGGRAEGVELRLRAGGRVHVRVVDAAGTPLSAVEVTAEGAELPVTRRATTDAEGRAEVAPLYDGRYRVTVRDDALGRAADRAGVTTLTVTPALVDVTDGAAPGEVVLRLVPGP